MTMDAQILMHLTSGATRYLVADVYKESVSEKVLHYATPFSPRTLILDAFSAATQEAIRSKGEGKRQDSDQWLAPRVHASLRLTRAEAADPSIWIFLAATYPEYIRWRWTTEGKIPQERITGNINRQGYARLWWIAELTRNGDDYGTTVSAMANQDAALQLIDIDAFHNRPAALAYIEKLQGMDNLSQYAKTLAKRINHALTVAPLDVIAPDQGPNVNRMMEWIQTPPDASTICADQLPKGPDEDRIAPAKIASVLEFYNQIETQH